MMVLKEAYRYQNYLDKLIVDAEIYLYNDGFVTKTVEKHNRNKANPDAFDEEIKVEKPYVVEFDTNNLIDFLVSVIAEKEMLTNAIVVAKKTTEIDIDSSIAMNKVKQNYVSVLNRLYRIKNKETKAIGSDFCFDVNKEQKKYVYGVDRVTTIDFDRNDVKNLIRKYNKETDEVSAKLDLIQLTTVVNHVPKYELNSSLEDLIK